jgi:Flp pilus assembly protein TadG
VTLFMVLVTLALMLAVGLVVDGAHKIQALQRADAAAEEAARAAGQAIQPAVSVRGQAPRADTARAAAAAREYLAAAGVAGTVDVRGDVIEVTTISSRPTVFLAAIGIGSVSATGSAQARLVRGLEQEVP